MYSISNSQQQIKSIADSITLTSPLDYQVFQRNTIDKGIVRLSGIANDCNAIEYCLNGKNRKGKKIKSTWTTVAINDGHSFNLSIKTPAGGWYVLKVRGIKNGKVYSAVIVEHVGVGEIFVGVGQSNSTNCGGIKAPEGKYPLDGRTQTMTGMVSSYDGQLWRIANDPQKGVHDKWEGGSLWPSFGDDMYNKFKVPIGVAVTGYGGTSIAQWMKNSKEIGEKSKLYQWTLTRINQLGKNGFRAVLWHQGESDYDNTAKQYADSLIQMITDFRNDAGWNMPWFVANASFTPGKPVVDTNSRGGQKIVWVKGIALEGPDTDKLLGDLRDHDGNGIHFSKKGLKVHGEAWSQKVGAWLEKKLIK